MTRKHCAYWLALVLVLAGCAFSRDTADRPGPAATARYEGSGLRFELHGYEATALPALTVTGADGTDWTEQLTPVARDGETVYARLPGRSGLNRLAVENLTYTWTLPDAALAADGTGAEPDPGTVTGTIQYRDVRMRDLEWQLTDAGHLLIYHVRPLGRGEADKWHELLDWVLDSTGATLERPLVVWQFPDLARLNEWQRRGGIEIAGAWHEDIARMLTHGTTSRQLHEAVLVHEFVHAVSPLTGPGWYEEGIAQLIESRYDAEFWRGQTQGMTAVRSALQRLHELAGERTVSIFETSRIDETLNPYVLGVSFWLFVRHHHGDDGVQQLFRADVSGGGLRTELERLFGKELPYVWDDWNDYLRSPDLLADWEAGP